MQFGMPTLVGNRTLEENAALCAELGLSFIELNMNFPEYQLGFLERTDELLAAADRFGIYFTVHLDENLDVADFNPLVAEAWLETVRRTAAAAKKLLPLRGASGPLVLNMHMNHGVHITLPDRKVRMYERSFDTYMSSFARFRALAEEWIGGEDLVISIENTDGFADHEKKAVELLLESPCFGLTWDIGHSKSSREADVPFLLSHADRIVHFHVHDGTELPPRDHLALGDGETDLARRLEQAGELGVRCVLETKTAEALRRSAQWLRERSYLLKSPEARR